MFKLYRRIDGVLNYREGWQDDCEVIEHWGACGEQGESHKYVCSTAVDALHVLLDRERAARKAGFRGVSEEKHSILVVEFSLDGFADGSALMFRHRLEDHLDELTGWLGIGHCDGGSIGSGTLEAACMVVDYDIAAAALARELKGSQFAGYSRIYCDR